MTPTPEQLNNRKLLAQEVRSLLAANKIRPTTAHYVQDDVGDDDEPEGTCAVCAVGSLVVAQAHRKDPLEGSLEDAVNGLMHDMGVRSSMAAFSELTGLSYWETRAFEAAFMRYVVDSPGADIAHAERKGTLIREHEPLVDQALAWGRAHNLYLEDRLLVAMDLMESWAEGPVSFPLPAAKEKG